MISVGGVKKRSIMIKKDCMKIFRLLVCGAMVTIQSGLCAMHSGNWISWNSQTKNYERKQLTSQGIAQRIELNRQLDDVKQLREYRKSITNPFMLYKLRV